MILFLLLRDIGRDCKKSEDVIVIHYIVGMLSCNTQYRGGKSNISALHSSLINRSILSAVCVISIIVMSMMNCGYIAGLFMFLGDTYTYIYSSNEDISVHVASEE